MRTGRKCGKFKTSGENRTKKLADPFVTMFEQRNKFKAYIYRIKRDVIMC